VTKPCTSDKCNLWDSGCFSALIPATGSKKPDLLVIGPAPYGDDDLQCGNFLGDSGDLLRGTLQEVGFDLNLVAFAQVVRCRPTQSKWGKTFNREPSAAEIKDCKPFILADIERLKPKGILLLGAVAFKAILGITGIVSNRGRVYDYEGMVALPTFHPEQVVRDDQYLEWFVRDIEKMYQELYEGKVEKLPVDYYFLDTLEGLKLLVKRAEQAKEVSFDLETSRLNPHMEDAQIVCASFSFVEREAFVVPLYHKDMIFQGRKLSYAKDVIREVVGSPLPKCGHNAKFDMTWLLVTEGIETANFAADTMLMQYLITEQAGTHSLDWLACRYVPEMCGYDQPLEEYKAQHKEADPKRGGSYRNIDWGVLYPYACMDSDVTLRCYHELEKLLVQESKV
jgi:uracil-DNA glycosylase family 4